MGGHATTPRAPFTVFSDSTEFTLGSFANAGGRRRKPSARRFANARPRSRVLEGGDEQAAGAGNRRERRESDSPAGKQRKDQRRWAGHGRTRGGRCSLLHDRDGALVRPGGAARMSNRAGNRLSRGQ